jgi:hypothetical protein
MGIAAEARIPARRLLPAAPPDLAVPELAVPTAAVTSLLGCLSGPYAWPSKKKPRVLGEIGVSAKHPTNGAANFVQRGALQEYLGEPEVNDALTG